MKTKLLFLIKTNSLLHFLLSGIYILFLQAIMKDPLSLCEGGFPLLGGIANGDPLDEDIIKFITTTGYPLTDIEYNNGVFSATEVISSKDMFTQVVNASQAYIDLYPNLNLDPLAVITQVLKDKNTCWNFYPTTSQQLDDMTSRINLLFGQGVSFYINYESNMALDILTVMYFEISNTYLVDCNFGILTYDAARQAAIKLIDYYRSSLEL